MLTSSLYHVFVVVALWGLSVTWLTRPPVRTHSPWDKTTLTYYSVSEYLPEIDTGSPPAAKEQRGEPAYAKQKIISLPPAPDNFRQTIITPSKVRLPAEAALPNLVAWTPVPSPIPEAAMTHARLIAPAPVTPIQPPPDPRALRSRLHALPAPDVVEAAADPTSVSARAPRIPAPEVVAPPPSVQSLRSNLPALPAPAVVGPAVSGMDDKRPIGALSIAKVNVEVAAPELPVSEQRPNVLLRPAAHGRVSPTSSGADFAPPPSIVADASKGDRGAGQILALNVNPARVSGPIAVPAGSRHGEFAAGPEGKPGAPGTPDVHVSGSDANGIGNGNSHAAPGIPPGISISPGPSPAPSGPVVAGTAAPLTQSPIPTLSASLKHPSVAELARATRPGDAVPAPTREEARVFAGKKYYSLVLNMPNLTSATGSWIIRFAELHETEAGELSPPVATLKVDPAYPSEAIRERVEGTVTLYAVIRKDGTVGSVRVLRSVDERLDTNARVALEHWHFRPAMKNGEAVDLEAVVQIPFQARRSQFNGR